MERRHKYTVLVDWIGNLGTGTSGYRDYERGHTISSIGKPLIAGSSDPAFRGDKTKYNPEELLVASIASCHMLWYLHLCTDAGIIVTQYSDKPIGIMKETVNGSGIFEKVTICPTVTVLNNSMIEEAQKLHTKANEMCYIANSTNFPIYHDSTIRVLKV